MSLNDEHGVLSLSRDERLVTVCSICIVVDERRLVGGEGEGEGDREGDGDGVREGGRVSDRRDKRDEIAWRMGKQLMSCAQSRA